MHASRHRRPSPATLVAAFVALAIGGPGVGSLDSSALARDAVEVAQVAGVPELHSVSLLDDFADRTLLVEGASFGASKGRARVGGKRARVTAWDDTAITLKVPRRLRPSGVVAVEITTDDGLAPHYPLPVRLPDRSCRSCDTQGRLALRVGSRARGYTASSCTFGDNFEAGFRYSRGRIVIRRERVRRCHLVYGWLWPRRVCRMVVVARRVRLTRDWYVTLRLPAECAEPGPPTLWTSAEQGALGPPIDCQGPNAPFTVDAGADDWWVVIGRDEAGVFTGQFGATTVTGKRPRRASGTFRINPMYWNQTWVR